MFWYAARTNIITITLVNGVLDLKVDDGEGWAFEVSGQTVTWFIIRRGSKAPTDLVGAEMPQCLRMSSSTLVCLTVYMLYLILRIIIFKSYPAPTTEQVWVHLWKKSALIPTSLSTFLTDINYCVSEDTFSRWPKNCIWSFGVLIMMDTF